MAPSLACMPFLSLFRRVIPFCKSMPQDPGRSLPVSSYALCSYALPLVMRSGPGSSHTLASCC